ncbi:MAG: hypothetical protein HY952_03605 [Elusimicrobia bacterium]|nr:hypothetical protein [Elusimicrobiota bacterium]
MKLKFYALNFLVLTGLALGFVMVARAELVEVRGSECQLVPRGCIEKNGKFYTEFTAEDKTVAARGQEQYQQTSQMWGRLSANGWNPTLANLDLWDAANERPYPGAKDLLARRGLRGGCYHETNIDCHLPGDCTVKYGNIKDRIARTDKCLDDNLLYRAYLHTLPRYRCSGTGCWGGKYGKDAQCEIIMNGKKMPVVCDEEFKKNSNKKPLSWAEFTPSGSGAVPSSTGTSSTPAAEPSAKKLTGGGNFTPFATSNDKDGAGVQSSVVIGGGVDPADAAQRTDSN